MLRIAICDDEIVIVEQVRSFINELYSSDLEITEFHSGETLVKAFKALHQEERFDLIFLDIEMRGMNGVLAAKEIRKKDSNVLIIYISNYENYHRLLFEVEPFRFIKKPVMQEEFKEIFKIAYQRVCDKMGNLEVKYKGSIKEIPYSQIIYFRSEGRNVNIFVRDDEEIYNFTDKLDYVEKKFEKRKEQFLRVHKSYLVNYTYIKIFEYTRIVLFNDEVISISQDRREDVRKMYMRLLGEQIGNE